MKPPLGLATLIGSVPHTDPDVALTKILSCVPEAPIWPQLPKRDWREGFLPQYAEGLPGLIKHPDDAKVSVDSSADLAKDLAAFYEAAMAAPENGDFSRFAISENASMGIPAALARFEALTEKPPYIKVHCTGPVSFALTVFDQNDRPLFFDDTFADVTLQSAIMKSIWQIRLFKTLGEEIICFLDEPVLSAFGSSTYINVRREDVVAALSTAVEAIHAEGALVGVHVCGNSEWTILIDAGVDIINFDAYFHGEGMAIYAEAVAGHLAQGGALAWGIIPTADEIHRENAESLDLRLKEVVGALVERGVEEDLIWRQSILTPSCGMGTMTLEESEMVMDRLFELSQRVQSRLRT